MRLISYKCKRYNPKTKKMLNYCLDERMFKANFVHLHPGNLPEKTNIHHEKNTKPIADDVHDYAG